MAGGIIQLVATGKEDIIISDNPQITMFKTIYRRHTNFDKAETILTFNNNLTFGTSATCTIKKLADLVNALYLVVELPDIDISYVPLTNRQLASLLLPYDITWSYSSENADVLITQEEFEIVVGKITYISGVLTRLTSGMINDKVTDLTRTIDKDNAFIEIIQNLTDEYINNNDNNLTNYLDDLMLQLLYKNRELSIDDETYIDNYDYYNQYLYLYSYKRDLAKLTYQEILWQDTPFQIISFYDPSLGLPDQDDDVRYISSSSDRGWNINYVYSWNSHFWEEITPKIGYGSNLQRGFAGMTANMLYECIGFDKICLSLYDARNGLPENPSLNDKYICRFSGNNWIENYIYTWNGTIWTEQIPNDGNALFVLEIPDDGILSESNYCLLYYTQLGDTWIHDNTGKYSQYSYAPSMRITFDGTYWRKTIV